jgi:hypothetical protein
MLPVPSQTAGFGGVGAVHATVEHVDAAAILGPVSIDV